jgi:flavin reductase (DIM6/NTAB) family NADH-FMN oxidoreductase RutF
MKSRIDVSRFRSYTFPRIVALATAVKDGKPNIITLAWHSPISSEPPLYGISVSPDRYSHDLILDSGEFVVNFPPFEVLDQVHACGRVSGRDEDKFELTGFTPIRGEKVRPPLIRECYAHLECKVVNNVTLGDHSWMTGEVLAAHADEERFENELVKDVRPIYYVGKDTYTSISTQREKLRSRNR